MYMYVGSNPVIRGPLLEICRRKISIQTPLHTCNPRPRQSASSRFLPTPNFSTAPKKSPKHHKNAPGNRNRDFTGVGARYDIRPCTRRENTKHAGTSGSRPGRLWAGGRRGHLGRCRRRRRRRAIEGFNISSTWSGLRKERMWIRLAVRRAKMMSVCGEGGGVSPPPPPRGPAPHRLGMQGTSLPGDVPDPAVTRRLPPTSQRAELAPDAATPTFRSLLFSNHP